MFFSEKLFEWEVVQRVLFEKKHTFKKKKTKIFTEVFMVVRIDAFET